jgi:response regulator RpfG family c-di-GMP phosphodiesterase
VNNAAVTKMALYPFVRFRLYALNSNGGPGSVKAPGEADSLIRIFIVDDHHHFRTQLRSLLESVEEWQVCGEAENGVEAIEKHWSFQPHVTAMDFNMPELNGLHASHAILRKCPTRRFYY